ncbi:methyltransferase [Selenomonas sp. oral taxon 920]|uniref:methyltransferase n=1 Tax=Selenomonas sp. oral taxon 920 TaxID=1884263 RepID=UPI000840BE64|nr:methyltransferase [Selenomonas sp. oral taxon 920]AOH47241.1 methyltransferase [Selenomonas sp. oral taxon 920]
MLFMEEAFVEYLWKQGIFKEKDIMGKNCLVVGGSYIVGENYAPTLRSHLLRMGALRCDNIMLFDPHFRESFCDLTDTKEAIGSLCYDVIIVLSGMEKTRNIREGVYQLQEACRVGGKIFVVARTPKDISARQEINAYEDLWRYDVQDLSSLFGGCSLEMTTSSDDGEIVAAVFTRGVGAAESRCRALFCTRTQKRADIDGELPRGYFDEASDLDVIGIKHHTDKCSMIHNYLGKYEFFLQCFRNQPIRLLELGIFQGASLRMWQEYFPHAEIFGVDIREGCSQYEDERIHVIQTDLSNVDAVIRLKDIRPQIIIDDASHIVSHQLLALFTLFDVLPSGGVYILEDLETSLNPEQFEDAYRDCPLDAYEVCSRIARITARKVPDDNSIYAEHINRIGMQAELVSVMKGSVVFIKR